ncbi:unnamed protein product [Gordionus sp. m RMFG-2023]
MGDDWFISIGEGIVLPVSKVPSLVLTDPSMAQSWPESSGCHRASKIGHQRSHCRLGRSYVQGRTVGKIGVCVNPPATLTIAAMMSFIVGGGAVFFKDLTLRAIAAAGIPGG